MFVLVCYDISDDALRTRMHRLLHRYGTHVQESVFECHLTHRQYRALCDRIDGVIDPDSTDSVRLYPLGRTSLHHALVKGTGYISREPRYYLI